MPLAPPGFRTKSLSSSQIGIGGGGEHADDSGVHFGGTTVRAADKRQGSVFRVCRLSVYSSCLYTDGNIALCYSSSQSFWGLKPSLFQTFGYCLKLYFLKKKLLLLFVDPLSFERLALPSLIKMP